MSVALATKGIIAPKGDISVQTTNLILPLTAQVDCLRSIVADIESLKTLEGEIELLSLCAEVNNVRVLSAEVTVIGLRGEIGG